MIKWEKRVLLVHYLEQGLPIAAIARELGVDRRTVHRWKAACELQPDPETGLLPQKVRRAAQPCKLDPYRDIIQTRLKSYPELSAVRLFDEVKAAGYDGGYSRVRDYVREVRPRSEPEPVIRFETVTLCRGGWQTDDNWLVNEAYTDCVFDPHSPVSVLLSPAHPFIPPVGAPRWRSGSASPCDARRRVAAGEASKAAAAVLAYHRATL